MASFAVLQNDGKYHLREPLVPAQSLMPGTVKAPLTLLLNWRIGLLH